MIPHSRPAFGTAFQDAMRRVLDSGQLAAGAECEALEREVAAAVGVAHAAGVDSGTSALVLALYALKVEHDIKRVGIPAYVCRSVLHAVRAVGGEPVCMDCSDELRLVSPLAKDLAGSLDAVIIVHPFGLIEPMVRETWPCPVVEDIAQAAGGSLDGCKAGSFGDVSIASFYATKPWGGACGGMVLSNKPEICDLVCQMRDADKADATLPYAGNHQLSDVHAALARTRLSLAAEELVRRRRLAKLYDGWFTDLSGAPVLRETSCNHYRYVVRVEDAAGVIEALRSRGVGAARPVEVPLSELAGQRCPGAQKAWRECVSLPLLADMSGDETALMHKAVAACM